MHEAEVSLMRIENIMKSLYAPSGEHKLPKAWKNDFDIVRAALEKN